MTKRLEEISSMEGFKKYLAFKDYFKFNNNRLTTMTYLMCRLLESKGLYYNIFCNYNSQSVDFYGIARDKRDSDKLILMFTLFNQKSGLGFGKFKDTNYNTGVIVSFGTNRNMDIPDVPQSIIFGGPEIFSVKRILEWVNEVCDIAFKIIDEHYKGNFESIIDTTESLGYKWKGGFGKLSTS